MRPSGIVTTPQPSRLGTTNPHCIKPGATQAPARGCGSMGGSNRSPRRRRDVVVAWRLGLGWLAAHDAWHDRRLGGVDLDGPGHGASRLGCCVTSRTHRRGDRRPAPGPRRDRRGRVPPPPRHPPRGAHDERHPPGGNAVNSYGYGLWLLVIVNSAVFIIFAASFFHPRTKRDWKAMGAFSSFIVALMVEMYGFPLTIYFLAGWLGSRFDSLTLTHDGGHLWSELIGWQGDPHMSPCLLYTSPSPRDGLLSR